MDTATIIATLGSLLPYLVKGVEFFSEEAGKGFSSKAGEELFSFLKSRFTTQKGAEVIERIEKGESDPQLIDSFQTILDTLIDNNAAFKDSLSQIVEANREILVEALSHATNEFESTASGLGSDVVNSQGGGSVHINKTIIQHFHSVFEENAPFEVRINTSKFSKQVNDEKLALQIENKLFLISVYIQEARYKESLALCEELIKIHSQIPDVWEYKAICTYLNTDKRNIIKESAKSILVYLGAAITLRDNKKESNHSEIAKEISYRYFKTIQYKIDKIFSDAPNIKNLDLFKLISEFRTCYKINPEVNFLEEYVNFLAGRKGFTWLYLGDEIDSRKTFSINHNGKVLNLIDRSPSSDTIQKMIDRVFHQISQIDKDYTLPPYQFFSYKFDRALTADQYFSLIEENSSKLAIEKADLTNQLIQAEELLVVYQKELNWEKKKWFSNIVPYQYKVDQTSRTIEKLRSEIVEIDKRINVYQS